MLSPAPLWPRSISVGKTLQLKSILRYINRAVVINLDRRPERLKLMKANLDALGLIDFERFAAVDGRALNHTFLKSLNISVSPKFGRGLSFAEVACFISHYRIWQQIAHQPDSNYRALVLEDDIRFFPFFMQNLHAVISYARNNLIKPDLLYIGREYYWSPRVTAEQRNVHNQLPATHYKLIRSSPDGWGTHGYILSSFGARKLLAAQPLGKLLPADVFLGVLGLGISSYGNVWNMARTDVVNNSHPGIYLNSFTADPVLITQLQMCYDSSSEKAVQSDMSSQALVFM